MSVTLLSVTCSPYGVYVTKSSLALAHQCAVNNLPASCFKPCGANKVNKRSDDTFPISKIQLPKFSSLKCVLLTQEGIAYMVEYGPFTHRQSVTLESSLLLRWTESCPASLTKRRNACHYTCNWKAASTEKLNQRVCMCGTAAHCLASVWSEASMVKVVT